MKPVSGQFAHSQILQRMHSDHAPSLRHRDSRVAVQSAEAKAVSVAKAAKPTSVAPPSAAARIGKLNILV